MKTAQPNLSIRKGFDVLESLAFAREAMTTGQIAAKLGIDKSVASRILLTLGEMGYVQRVGRGVWQPSSGLAALSIIGLRNSPLMRIRPELQTLQKEVGCIVAVGFLWKEQVIYLFHSGNPDGPEGLGHVYPAEESSIGRLLSSEKPLGHKLLWAEGRTRFSVAVPLRLEPFRYGLAVSGPAEKWRSDLIERMEASARRMEALAGAKLP